MNPNCSEIKIRYIKTGKNKIRKIVSYKSADSALRKRHEMYHAFIKRRFIPSIFAKGYIKGRSIYHNALAHMYNDRFIMLDIKDFFLNISHEQLIKKLYYELNKRKPNQINMRECLLLVNDCSIVKRGLPLGFVTSPILSNIYLKEFDGVLYGQLKKMHLDHAIFTRYVDDIVISYKAPTTDIIPDIDRKIIDIVKEILLRYCLRLNPTKTRHYNLYVSNHVKITGVNIVKSADGRRYLSVGKAKKNKLFWDAIRCCEDDLKPEISRIKGEQSFILSIEKNGYESSYSQKMMDIVHALGYESLKKLIDSLHS